MSQDIRWIQRFDSYQKALKRLDEAIELSKQRELSLLEKQGLIQAFEFTHELAWKMLKDYLEYQGYQNIKGSRDAIRKAFEIGIVSDGKLWMNSIEARNYTSHAYDEEILEDAFNTISQKYIELFYKLRDKFNLIKEEENQYGY